MTSLHLLDINPGAEHVVDQLWEVQEPSAQPQHHHRHCHHNIHFATADGRCNIKFMNKNFKLDNNSTNMLRASLGQKYNDQYWEFSQLPGSYLMPDICQFWYTTALCRPVKRMPKSA